MQANRSDATPEPSCCLGNTDDQQTAEAAILNLLLASDYDGPWTVTDVKSWLSSPEAAIEEALIDLRKAGLIYAHEGLVFARLAARTMDRLNL